MSNEMDEVNRMFRQIMGHTRQASYRYFARPGSRDRYFYTVEKINHKGSPKYVAGIYRYLSSRNAFKLVKTAGFAKRYKATAAAQAYRDKEAAAVAAGKQRQ
jgi:hypothetical protein